MRIIKFILLPAIIILIALAIPEFIYKNSGVSISNGDYHIGSLKNGYLLPRKGKNFVYGSLLSYYILDRAYVNSSLYKTITSSYKEMQEIYPDQKFVILECSRKHGGRMFPHRTHQNGLSVDFFVPLVKWNHGKYFAWLGIFRYALNFDKTGKLNRNKNIAINFDVMAKHILVLDKQARNHGLRIKKVIFNIELKKLLYSTPNGKLLLKKGIYFAQNLTPQLNKLHDDHYHVDFEKLP